MAVFSPQRKLNQAGFLHHIAILVFIVIFGCIGFYVFSRIFAATVGGGSGSSIAAQSTPEIIAHVLAPGKWCISDHLDSYAAANPITTAQCDGAASQHWTVDGKAIMHGGDECLSVLNDSKDSGAYIVQRYCADSKSLNPGQVWDRYNGGFKNPYSGKCLSVYGSYGKQLRTDVCNTDSGENFTPSAYKDPALSSCGATAKADPTQAKCVAKIVMTENPYGLDPNKKDSAGQTNYSCLVDLWTRESGWNRLVENPGSGAYGIAQALGHGDGDGGQYPPAYDTANPPDSSAIEQIKWGLGYIESAYGPHGMSGFSGPVSTSPCMAWKHETNVGWYGVDQTNGVEF